MRKYQPLSKTLVILVLLASSIITTLMTAVSFYIDYRSEIKDLEQSLAQIETVTVPSLALSLWNVNDTATGNIAEGLKNVSSVVDVIVEDDEGQIRAKTTTTTNKENLKYLYKKEFKLSNRGIGVGTLKITGTKQFLYQRLIQKAVVFFITQGIKTMVISAILLIIFKLYVTNHIDYLASTLNKEKFSGQPLKLNKPHQPQNELDTLVSYYNDLIERIKENDEQKTQTIENHKATAINASRLASLGEMATGIAHEINNPLAIIQGNTHIALKKVRKELSEDARVTRHLDRVITTSERISNIVQGLKTYGRDAHSDSFKEEKLNHIISNVLILCSEKFRNANIDFEVAPPPEIQIYCQYTSIIQVIINLLNNAFDAVEHMSKKSIAIDFEKTQNTVTILFTDSGKGISSTEAEKIFDPFYSTKEVGEGTGLGLSISYSTMEDHNGKLYLKESKPGKTCFAVEIPLSLQATG